MELHVQVIRASFEALRPRAQRVSARFHRVLRERHPEIASLFDASNTAAGRRELFKSIAYIVARLDRPRELTYGLQLLGAAHAQYIEHYHAVSESMLVALEEVSGDGWGEEQATAWRGANAIVSELLQVGARCSAA